MSDATRASYLKRVYGITLEQYACMLDHQQGACWICGWQWREGKRRLAVDHDHKSNIVRGLLCYRCNKGIGVFRDNASTLKRASEYLQQPWAQRNWVTPPRKSRRYRKVYHNGMSSLG